MKVHKRLEGEVQYNDGQFAEVQTVGTEGHEQGLLLDTIQLHREDTNDTREEFHHRFPVGMWLDVWTTTKIGSDPTLTLSKPPCLERPNLLQPEIGARGPVHDDGLRKEARMDLDEKRVKVRHHLEAAVRLQRESWDNSLAVEDILGNRDRDIYALLAELAGGLKDDEAITEDIIDTLISLIPGFESRAGFAAFGRGGKDV